MSPFAARPWVDGGRLDVVTLPPLDDVERELLVYDREQRFLSGELRRGALELQDLVFWRGMARRFAEPLRPLDVVKLALVRPRADGTWTSLLIDRSQLIRRMSRELHVVWKAFGDVDVRKLVERGEVGMCHPLRPDSLWRWHLTLRGLNVTADLYRTSVLADEDEVPI